MEGVLPSSCQGQLFGAEGGQVQDHLQGRPIAHLRRPVCGGLLPCPKTISAIGSAGERIGLGCKNGEVLQLRADWLV
jgi:hypothetical protein